MTIYLNLYIIIYLVTLVKINYLLINFVFLENSQNSMSYIFTYIAKFNKLKSVIFGLFLSLAGLPPFIMFFVKFNYLINLLYKCNFFLILIIFLIFFLNMLFYTQIFFHKNTNIQLKLIKNNKKKILNYKNIFYINWFLLFNLFSVFFFSDLYFFFKLIIIGNI
jgi:formate hydrogenlyase subunit 3/multisubunit Na+/H+ antiporter MnhD subunit